jgi:hypothetical protein
MNSRQRETIIYALPWLSFVLLTLSQILFARFEPIVPISQSPLSFNAIQAYQYTQEFVTQFPKRVFGSFESREATGYLNNRLIKLGYTVEYFHFDGRIGKHKQVGRNILALKNGKNPEILAVIAHFDTATTTVQGAMKNGAAVGVLLELARVFANSPTNRSILFIFSDGGEWGSLGAQDIAANYPERHRIAAVLSLDHVSIDDLAAFQLEETGQMKGYAPPWLRQLVKQAVEKQKMPVQFRSGFREIRDRALLISNSDQGPFLKAGIPAINLGSRSSDPFREKAVYHSPYDTIGNLKLDSIKKYGQVAERIVWSLDNLPSIPRETDTVLFSGRLLNAKVASFVMLICFLPLLFVFFDSLKNLRGKLNKFQIGRELLLFAGTLLPFSVFYLGIRIVTALHLFPRYTLYPATLKDPVLQTPAWNILGWMLLAAVVVTILYAVIAVYVIRDRPRPEFSSSKLVLLGLMLITVVLAWIYNPYWAISFLLLPAMIWSLIQWGASFRSRVGLGVLALAAGIPYFSFLWIYASRLELGWNFGWYQVLALSTKMFTPSAYFLGAATVAIGIRFLVLQTRRSN